MGIPVAFYCLAYYCFALDLSFIIDMLISFGSFIASYFLRKGSLHESILMKLVYQEEITDMFNHSFIMHILKLEIS